METTTTTNSRLSPPPTAHISYPSKPPAYGTEFSAADLESQNTEWTAPPPPAYYPRQTRAFHVPLRVSVQQQNERRQQQRRGLICCLVLALLLLTVSVVAVVVRTVAINRYDD